MNELLIFFARDLIFGILAGAVTRVWITPALRLKLFYIAVVALPLGYGLARLAGLLFSHPQPFATENFEPLIPHEVDNAFPSDHVLFAGIFASIAFLANRRFGLVLWALALIVGLARVGAGLHYSVDIFAAAALALLAVCIAQEAVKFLYARLALSS